jgi:hypothetical protein
VFDPEPGGPISERPGAELRPAVDDDPRRLPGGVGIDHPDATHNDTS